MTLEEAKEKYKGNPAVKFKGYSGAFMVNSKTIHADNVGIWCKNFNGLTGLLFDSGSGEEAEIIKLD